MMQWEGLCQEELLLRMTKVGIVQILSKFKIVLERRRLQILNNLYVMRSISWDKSKCENNHNHEV